MTPPRYADRKCCPACYRRVGTKNISYIHKMCWDCFKQLRVRDSHDDRKADEVELNTQCDNNQ